MTRPPFTVGVPSWVIPGTYAENLRFLEGKSEIGAVELLFYLWDEAIQAELESDLATIRSLSSRFAYSAHLPSPLSSSHARLVEVLSPLVSQFVFHPESDAASLAATVNPWISRFTENRFLLENTRMEDFNSCLPLLPGAGICLDTGHILIEGGSPALFCTQYESRLHRLHLHSIVEKATDGRLRDHRALRGDEGWLCDLMPFLSRFNGTVELELFSWEEVEQSLKNLSAQGNTP